jgi:hypothetical protein
MTEGSGAKGDPRPITDEARALGIDVDFLTLWPGWGLEVAASAEVTPGHPTLCRTPRSERPPS